MPTDTDAWETYERSLERLTLIGASAEDKERAAFEAGRAAGQSRDDQTPASSP